MKNMEIINGIPSFASEKFINDLQFKYQAYQMRGMGSFTDEEIEALEALQRSQGRYGVHLDKGKDENGRI
jgi:hypothetical protein